MYDWPRHNFAIRFDVRLFRAPAPTEDERNKSHRGGTIVLREVGQRGGHGARGDGAEEKNGHRPFFKGTLGNDRKGHAREKVAFSFGPYCEAGFDSSEGEDGARRINPWNRERISAGWNVWGLEFYL